MTHPSSSDSFKTEVRPNLVSKIGNLIKVRHETMLIICYYSCWFTVALGLGIQTCSIIRYVAAGREINQPKAVRFLTNSLNQTISCTDKVLTG